jgi:tetratricopeptide (TPR) repeat protein
MNERAYDLHQFLGQAYDKLGRLDEALGEFAYAAMLNPHSTVPLIASAEVHLKRREIPLARKRLLDAERIDPASFELAVVSARVLEQEERLDEALAAYEKAIAINDANPKPRTLLVSVASRLQRFDLAEAQLRALLEMGYQPSRTYFALGRLAQLRGRADEAAAHYRRALELEPGLPMAEEGLRRLAAQPRQP